MEKYENLSDEVRLKIVAEEITEFKKIIKDYEKLLKAIGEL